MPLIWQIPDDETETDATGEGRPELTTVMEPTTTSTKNDPEGPIGAGRVGLIDFLKGPKGVMELKEERDRNTERTEVDLIEEEIEEKKEIQREVPDEKDKEDSRPDAGVRVEKPEADDSGMEAGITDEEDTLSKSQTSLEISVTRNNEKLDEMSKARRNSESKDPIKEEEKPEDTEEKPEEKKYGGVFEDRTPKMTKKFIQQTCKENKLYQTPHLNDILYLHYKGFAKLEGLEEYTGLKCVFLEVNGIQRIENLDNQKELKCLYLQQNLIKKIENMEPLVNLTNLNLSNNFIRKIENLSCLPNLSMLQMTHNHLMTREDVEHLSECPKLSSVDLSHNRIADETFIDVFPHMKALRVLVLTGNPGIRNIRDYRRRQILAIKDLQYLDDRPVFDKERACVEAWGQGGKEAEKKCREDWISNERKRITDSVTALVNIRRRAKRLRRERLIARGELPKEALDAPLSDEEVNADAEQQAKNEDKSTNGKSLDIWGEVMRPEDKELLEEGTPSSSSESEKENESDTDSDFSFDEDEKERETDLLGISAVCDKYNAKEKRCKERKKKKKLSKGESKEREGEQRGEEGEKMETERENEAEKGKGEGDEEEEEEISREERMAKDAEEMTGFKMQIEDDDESKDKDQKEISNAKFNPQVEREKWIIEELMKPPGWSPYDYPESERDKVNFEGWKPEKESTKATKSSQSGVAGLESLFSQSQKTQRVTPKEERRALIEDLDKDVDESESDAETSKNNREQRHLHPQMPSPFNNASQERDLALKMESCLKVIDDEDDGVDVIDAVEQCNRGNGVNVRKQAWNLNGPASRGDFFADGNQRQETFKPKIQFLSGEEEEEESLLSLESSTFSRGAIGEPESAPAKWAKATENKRLIEELPDAELREGSSSGMGVKSIGTPRVSNEEQQSLHLIRGLLEMDSTGFSRKGVIEIGAGDVKEPFRGYDDYDPDNGEETRESERRVLVEELEEEDGEGLAIENGEAASRCGEAEEFLRSGGVVDYNLSTFGFQ